jgi:hypothetical protein
LTKRVAAASLLGSAVHVSGSRIGHVTGVYVDPGSARALGLEVRTPDRRMLFLPWVATYARGGHLTADSSLVFVDVSDLDGYTHRGAIVHHDPDALDSVYIGRDGSIEDHDGSIEGSGRGVSLALAAGMPVA